MRSKDFGLGKTPVRETPTFDHVFNSSDLVSVFRRGKYESNSLATWSDGDWNCDGLVGSGDLVAAFQRGWYEAAPANAVAADSTFGSHTILRGKRFR
jgi:hypothetical protein